MLPVVSNSTSHKNGMHPMQVTAAHIEMIYDYLLTRVDRDTACLKFRGLKKSFAGAEKGTG